MIYKRHAAMTATIACAMLLLVACGSETSSTDAAGTTTEVPAEVSTPPASEEPGAGATFSVDSWAGLPMDSERTKAEYEMLAKASKAWNLCVSVPHVKDPYWLGLNYGVTEQAKAAGVNLNFVEAGGYENIDKQIQQIEDCSTNADAVIIGAISFDGLNTTVDKLAAEGKPVIDVINGMSSEKVTAKSLVSFGEMAAVTADWLIKDSAGEPVKVAWFPGPKGAGWSEDGNKQFLEKIAGTNVELVDTKWGDTGKDVQSQLIEDALSANPEVDYLIGTAVTAEAAGPILRDKGLDKKVRVAGYYFTPGTLEGLLRGTVLAAPSDSTVLQGRIAVDQAIRALQGDPLMIHVGPELVIVTADTLSSFDTSSTLAPDGFKPVFKVETG